MTTQIPYKYILTLTAASLLFAITMIGCDSDAKSGALWGAGIGALAGQAIGGDTGGTLIGAAVGSGIGYMIGNEQDKEHAQQMTQAQPNVIIVHNEVGALGGTRWHLISILPPNTTQPPYTSKIIEFRNDGHVVTTTTRQDGTVDVQSETYRVVADVLIINKPGYLINARFTQTPDQLIVSAEQFRAVFQRL